MKAILYIRVSTEEQEKGYSQRSQLELLERYCQQKGYEIVTQFTEDHTATTFDRPEFKKLLVMIKKEKNCAQLLLFKDWSRFSRKTGQAFNMIETLQKYNIEPRAIEQPLDISVPESIIMLSIYISTPEAENVRRSMNIKAGQRRAMKEGRVIFAAPLGYQHRQLDGKKFIEPSAKAPLIKWIFETIATGLYSVEAVMRMARTQGMNLSRSSFHVLVKNPVYISRLVIKAYKSEEETEVDAQHAPLVTEDLFYKVQDVLGNRKKKQVSYGIIDDRFPLRGHLLCPKDGKVLTASSSKGRKQYYDYYHCQGGCNTRYATWAAHECLEKEIAKWQPNEGIKTVLPLVLHDVYAQRNKVKITEAAGLRKEIEVLTERLERSRNLLLDNILDAEDWNAIKLECKTKIVIAKEKQAELSAAEKLQPMISAALETMCSIDQLYKTGTTAFKKKVLDSIFPENLTFDGKTYRTARVNEFVRLIYNVSAAFQTNKTGLLQPILQKSGQVEPTGQFSNQFMHDLKLLATLAA